MRVARGVCVRHRAAVRDGAGQRAGLQGRFRAAGGRRRRVRRALCVGAASGRDSGGRRPSGRSPRAASRRGRTASTFASHAMCVGGVVPRVGRAPAIVAVAEGGFGRRRRVSTFASHAVCGCGIGPRFEMAPASVPGAEGGFAPREEGVDIVSRAVCERGVGPQFEMAPAIVPVAEGGFAPRGDGVDVRVVRRVGGRHRAAGREVAGHRAGRRGRLRAAGRERRRGRCTPCVCAAGCRGSAGRRSSCRSRQGRYRAAGRKRRRSCRSPSVWAAARRRSRRCRPSFGRRGRHWAAGRWRRRSRRARNVWAAAGRGKKASAFASFAVGCGSVPQFEKAPASVPVAAQVLRGRVQFELLERGGWERLVAARSAAWSSCAASIRGARGRRSSCRTPRAA